MQAQVVCLPLSRRKSLITVIQSVETLLKRCKSIGNHQNIAFIDPLLANSLKQPNEESSTEQAIALSVLRMKEHANILGNYIENDKESLKRLAEEQHKSKEACNQNLSSIIRTLEKDSKLGFFALLKMGLAAITIFVFTMLFIWLDAMIF